MKFPGIQSKALVEKLPFILIPLFLLIGLAIKFQFMFQGSLWPDEALYLYISRNLFLNPLDLTDISGKLFYHSPPMLMYLLSPLSLIKMIPFDQAARGAVILMTSGMVLIVYFTGKKIFNPIVGIIAAGLMAVCPLSNWTGVRILTDMPVVFFIYLAICMLAYDKKKLFYFFGICAVLTKYSAFPVLFLPLLMKAKPKIWVTFYISVFISLLVFVITATFYPKPTGWIAYFYSFFHLPDMLHMVKETEFFFGYFLLGFAAFGAVMMIREEKYSALFHWVCIFGIFRFFLPWIIFRVSRYSLPLYPGLYIFAAYGFFRSAELIASKWPVYLKWATLFLIVSISSVGFHHYIRSSEMLAQTRNTFTGFDKACEYLMKQPGPHTVATASPRQVKYYGPQFEVYDLSKNISPANLRKVMEEKKIEYLSIDGWSPHLPEWFRSYDYGKNGFSLIYNEKNMYLFKLAKPL